MATLYIKVTEQIIGSYITASFCSISRSWVHVSSNSIIEKRTRITSIIRSRRQKFIIRSRGQKYPPPPLFFEQIHSGFKVSMKSHLNSYFLNSVFHEGRISDKETAPRARPKITPQTQIVSYSWSIFVCHIRPKNFRFLSFIPLNIGCLYTLPRNELLCQHFWGHR